MQPKFFGIALAAILGVGALTASPASAKFCAPVERGPVDSAFDTFVASLRDRVSGPHATTRAKPSQATFDLAMHDVRYNLHQAEERGNQREDRQAIWLYVRADLRNAKAGRAALDLHKKDLDSVSQKFGVPAEVIVSLWGKETGYGSCVGTYRLFDALASGAYDHASDRQRLTAAEEEIAAALLMVETEHLQPDQMMSSWAGAFGQGQMMPTAFQAAAVDFDGDGRRDVISPSADALASIAAKLKKDHWVAGQPWGYQVKLPADFHLEIANFDSRKGHDFTAKSIADWRALGVTMPDGARLPDNSAKAAIYLPAGQHGPALLLFPNFSVFLAYDNAVKYALSAAALSQKIATGTEFAPWPADDEAFSLEEGTALQTALKALGYDISVDGRLGPGTFVALRAYQLAHHEPADGFPTHALLKELQQATAEKPL